MERIQKELVQIVEEIKEEIYRIYNREQNKMSVELKVKLQRAHELRFQNGEQVSLNQSWTCPDCIMNFLGLSFIPFMESTKYKAMLDEYNKPSIEQQLVQDDINTLMEIKPPAPAKKSKKK